MSKEIRARVTSTSWHPEQGVTAVTIAIPGSHDLTRGEIVVLVVSEGAK